MIRPPLCFNIWRETCLIQLNAPFKFVAITASKSSSDIFMIRLSFVIPALFTRISRRPYFFTIPSIISLDFSKSLTLHCMLSAIPPFAVISFTTSSAFAAEPL